MDEDWILITELFDIFGRGWSKGSVLRRIDAGQLVEGRHYVDIRLPGAPYAAHRFNQETIRVDFFAQE